ncbi:uncharacterized protein [Panulirus ornatus]
MENGGYVNENNTVLATPDVKVDTSMPPAIEVAYLSPRTACACVENQTVCQCESTPHPKSKIELLTWVKPKGWILLGIGFAFVAWSAIFFTLSALQII